MAQKMTRALVFDERTDHYDIRFDFASLYGGLHCGDCFDVFTHGKWKPTHIEMNMKQSLKGFAKMKFNKEHKESLAKYPEVRERLQNLLE